MKEVSAAAFNISSAVGDITLTMAITEIAAVVSNTVEVVFIRR